MAASPVQPQDLQAVDLRQFRARDFHHLLEEQNAFWSRHLRWDFTSSRDLIRRFLDTRNLYGYALVKNGDPIGYSYFIHEQDKALIGDLFIARPARAAKRPNGICFTTSSSWRSFSPVLGGWRGNC